MTKANQFTAEYEVISAAFLAHAIDHPARGRGWSLRELAPVIGKSPSWLGHLRSGRSRLVSATVAQSLADAVGCHINVLFVPRVPLDSNNRSVA